MRRAVILPTEIATTLDRLTYDKEEFTGVLLYREQSNICLIETLWGTHELDSPDRRCSNVRDDEKNREIINEFFRQFPEYRFIDVHTHTIETIRRNGWVYANNFSDGDIMTMEEKLRENPDYMALLVTPRTKILMGRDDPELRIEDYRNYRENERLVSEALKIIRNGL